MKGYRPVGYAKRIVLQYNRKLEIHFVIVSCTVELRYFVPT